MTQQAGRTLRERRRELRRNFKLRWREAQRRLAQLPDMQKQKARRRRLLAVLIILLLACLSRCSCTPPPAPPAPPAPAGSSGIKPSPLATPRLKPRVVASPKVSLPARGKYNTEPPREPAWVEAFRLQVATRSQRLAACFTGAPKPGALRWTAALNPDTGAVSDHLLEALPPSEDLTPAQTKCTVNVLSHPGYAGLASQYVGTLPENVSLVLEF